MDNPNTIAGQQEGGLSSSISTAQQLVTKIDKNGNLNKDDNKQLLEIVKLLKESNQYSKLEKTDRKKIDKSLKDYHKEEIATQNKNALKQQASFQKNFDRLQKALGSAFAKIDKHIETYSQYSLKVNAALDGTQKTYATAVQNLTDAVGSTGLAKMSDVLTQMNSLTDKGIVANIEQNAFLMSIKDGIASTFDAANGTLLRLIKLQGEDSTANRLVMQASLKEYLNQTYQNSQYLYQQFDTVSANLLEATSLLSSSLSNSLETTVQKWLGSLSSMGLSDQAVNSISSAIGAVGSGNLKAINENMQNLVIMGANQVGLSYSDLLTGGLNAEQTDKLMTGMMQYLGTLEGNNVVLSEYANIFGMAVSDLVAARNALPELENISSTTTVTFDTSSLGDYLNKYNDFLNKTPAALYDNLFENMLFGMGQNVSSNKSVYGLYKAGGLIGDITGGLGLSGTVGNIVNLIGPGMQLAATLGGGESGFSITNIGKTLKGLVTSVGNLWNSPDALAAYTRLPGTNISTGTGELAKVNRQATEGSMAQRSTQSQQGTTGSASQSTGVTKSKSAGSDSWASEGGTVDVAISDSMAAIEEAQAARTADDIYEFLSDDVVTVTPYPETTSAILENITSYNLRTAQATEGILKFMYSKLAPYLLYESMNEANSLFLATQTGTDEDKARAEQQWNNYGEWASGLFGG